MRRMWALTLCLAQPLWASVPAESGPAAPAWWHSLPNPQLHRLIERSAAESPNVAQAKARLAEAQAAAHSTQAASGPRLNADASLKRSTGQGPNAPVQTAANAQLSGQWEWDTFGKQLAQQNAAQRRVQARQADVAAATLQVQTQTADTWANWRSCEAKAKLRTQDLASRERSLALARLREQAGVAPMTDTARSASAVHDSQLQLTALSQQCQQQLNALATLVSASAQELRQQLGATTTELALAELSAPLPAPAQVAASTLAQHPQVQSAEASLEAASQDSAATQAASKPSINLAALLGNTWLRALGVGSSAVSWSLGPSVSLNLFDGGQTKSQQAAASAREQLALAQVEAAVNNLAQDVQNALTAQSAAAIRSRAAAEQLQWQDDSLRAQEAALSLGKTSALDVEDARRSSLASMQQHLDALRDTQLAWVALVRATATHQWGNQK